MATWPERIVPFHLGIFVLRPGSDVPVARLPIYAEVVWAESLPPIPPDPRFAELVTRHLTEADAECGSSHECRTRVRAALAAALAKALPKRTRDWLLVHQQEAHALLRRVMHDAVAAAGGASLDSLDDADLEAALEAAIRTTAQVSGLQVNDPDNEIGRRISTFPLGVLATDHVGYVSYDLGRLPEPVRAAIADAIAALEDRDTLTQPATFILVHPYGCRTPFEALRQRRFTEAAVVARLEFDPPDVSMAFANVSMPSLQNPSLTDWRLSPASFSLQPHSLIGADGCETIVPSNVAVQEFNFYQVVALADPTAQPELADAAAERIKVGVVHEYRVSWHPLGHMLGQILYSLALAPAESVNLAVIDWTRRDATLRTETTKLDESLIHELRRERLVSETMQGAVREYQKGTSLMGGIAESVGLSVVEKGLGVAAGVALSLGASSATSRGSRTLTGETAQKLSENISQSSAATRELNSTVIVQSSQAEHQAIETRTVTNYNHSHALTFLYYEILRHYRVVTRFVRRRPVVLAKIGRGLVRQRKLPNRTVFEIRDDVLHESRKVLEPALLDERYRAGFDALAALRRRQAIAGLAQASAPLAPPPPGARLFRFLDFEFQSGGLVVSLEDADDVGFVRARLQLTDGGHVDVATGQALNAPGEFSQAGHWTFCSGKAVTPPVAWDQIAAIEFRFNLENDLDDLSFRHIKVHAIDTNGLRENLIVDHPYLGGDLIRSGNHPPPETLTVRLPPPPAPPLPRPTHELEQEVTVKELKDHVLHHAPYYERVLQLGITAPERAVQLLGFDTGQGSLFEKVENRALEMMGDYVAFPCTDPDWSQAILEAASSRELPEPKPLERLETLPTRGVFCEAKLGHCNASEEIDNTRFWDWQSSPIPHWAPDIAPVRAVTPQAQNQDATPTGFPQSLVNIVNPPAAPDPGGFAATMGVLGSANLFRDMSGQAQVADLIKRLSDNTIGIAEAANTARQIQSRGNGGGAASPNNAGTGGVGGPRATPSQPSSVMRDLHDLQPMLESAQRRGLITGPEAQAAFTAAASQALDLQQVGDRFSRAAVTRNQLIGQAGEVALARLLEIDGYIVFWDWRKHISGNGIDLVVLNNRGPSPEVWLLDNKAQMKGITGAEALTAEYFNASLTEATRFLENVSTHPKAVEAAKLLKANKYRKVVANAWAGADTRFTKKLIGSGLAIYDVRLAQLFADYAAWETAFKAIPKEFRRLVHMRGCATVGTQLFIIAAMAGTFVLIRSDNMRAILGEVVANGAMGLILDALPGGFFAGLVIGLESDEPARLRGIRKIAETVDGYWDADAPTQAAILSAIGDMVDHPLDIQDSELIQPESRIPVPPYTIPWWRSFPGMGNL